MQAINPRRKLKAFAYSLFPSLRLLEHAAELQTLIELASSLQDLQNTNRKCYPAIHSIDEWLASFELPTASRSTSLDLGCGKTPRNPFSATEAIGIDIKEDASMGIKGANLATEPIPCDDNSFNYCTAYDFIEHIPRILTTGDGRTTIYPFVSLMNEIHRVLAPGGLFLHQTPAFPSKQAFQDPTHVNLITEDTFTYYFCEPHLCANTIGYGFTGRFECVGQAWLDSAWLVGLLRAVK